MCVCWLSNDRTQTRLTRSVWITPCKQGGVRRREEPGNPEGADEIKGEKDYSEPQGILQLWVSVDF